MAHDNEIPSDEALKAKLATAPYVTMPTDNGGPDDEAIAAALNSEMVAGAPVPLSKLDVVTYFRRNQLWLGMDGKSGIKNSENVAALYAVDLYRDPSVTTIDVTDPLIITMLDDLVAAQLLSEANVAALTAMATPQISYPISVGAPGPLNAHDIPRIREFGT